MMKRRRRHLPVTSRNSLHILFSRLFITSFKITLTTIIYYRIRFSTTIFARPNSTPTKFCSLKKITPIQFPLRLSFYLPKFIQSFYIIRWPYSHQHSSQNRVQLSPHIPAERLVGSNMFLHRFVQRVQNHQRIHHIFPICPIHPLNHNIVFHARYTIIILLPYNTPHTNPIVWPHVLHSCPQKRLETKKCQILLRPDLQD